MDRQQARNKNAAAAAEVYEADLTLCVIQQLVLDTGRHRLYNRANKTHESERI